MHSQGNAGCSILHLLVRFSWTRCLIVAQHCTPHHLPKRTRRSSRNCCKSDTASNVRLRALGAELLAGSWCPVRARTSATALY